MGKVLYEIKLQLLLLICSDIGLEFDKQPPDLYEIICI